jgi:hypothetical protein
VVLLPGIRYSSQAPLLWFAREAAQARGWSAVELDELAPEGQEPFAWMRERAQTALEATDAELVVVIAKSLGSAAAPMVAESGLPAVWLTPLLVRPEVVQGLAAASAPALLVGSPADPSWGGGEMPSGDALEIVELDGLDHSLQVEGDPLASLDALREVTERIGNFLDRTES